jgi:hypothetical protein
MAEPLGKRQHNFENENEFQFQLGTKCKEFRVARQSEKSGLCALNSDV